MWPCAGLTPAPVPFFCTGEPSAPNVSHLPSFPPAWIFPSQKIIFTSVSTLGPKPRRFFSAFPNLLILIPYNSVSRGSNPVLNLFWLHSAEFLNVRNKQKILKKKNKNSVFINPLCNIFFSNSPSEKYWSFPVLHPFFFLWSTSQYSTIYSTLIALACQKHNWWFHQCYWHSCCRKRMS